MTTPFPPITVHRAARGWQLECELFLPRKRVDVFPFFSDAGNLERLTPDSLKFEIITPQPIEMKAGALIDYRLKIRGLPVKWRTEISVWEPPFCFVDRQVRGPYRWWIHEHRFEERDGGTWCTDTVRYGVPGGALINWLVVERDVRKIFEFRQRQLMNLFGANENSATPRAANLVTS